MNCYLRRLFAAGIWSEMFFSCFRLKPDLHFVCWSPGSPAWTAASEMYSSLGNRVEIQRSSSENLVDHAKWFHSKNTLVKWLVSSCCGELLSAQPDNMRPPFLTWWAELLHRWEIFRENANNLWTQSYLVLVWVMSGHLLPQDCVGEGNAFCFFLWPSYLEWPGYVSPGSASFVGRGDKEELQP